MIGRRAFDSADIGGVKIAHFTVSLLRLFRRRRRLGTPVFFFITPASFEMRSARDPRRPRHLLRIPFFRQSCSAACLILPDLFKRPARAWALSPRRAAIRGRRAFLDGAPSRESTEVMRLARFKTTKQARAHFSSGGSSAGGGGDTRA